MTLSPAYPIRTERLLLRPLTLGDVDDLVAYRSIEDVCRYVPFRPMSPADVAERVTGVWARTGLDDEGQSLTLGIEATASGRIVGDVVLFWHSREHARGEIGYVINPAFGGRGYATEAARALVDLAFDGLQLHRLTARIDARNGPSAALVTRLGFRLEAHLVQNEWFKGEWTDELDFAILADEWRHRA